MVNQEIIGYLNEGLNRGFSIGLLKQKLIEGGFDEREVEEAAVIAEKKRGVKEEKTEELEEVEKTGGKKWMKLAGICGIILIALEIVYSVLGNFISEGSTSGTILNIIFMLIFLVLGILFISGFIRLGKYSKVALLKISGWIYLIFVSLIIILTSVAGFAELGNIAGLLLVIFAGILIINCVLFAVGLIKAGERGIRFAKAAGIIELVSFVLAVVAIILTAVFAFSLINDIMDMGSVDIAAFQNAFVEQAVYMIIAGVGILAAGALGLVAYIFSILVLFNASKKFE